MVERLSELNTSDLDVINTAIEEFSADMVNEAPFSLGGDVRAAIDRYDDRIFFIFSICILNSLYRCFGHNTVEEIVAALEKEDSEWAKETLKLMSRVSPTSLKIALRQLHNGAGYTLGQCFKMEFHLVQKFLVS